MGVEDATLSLLHDIYTHLDKVGCCVRILFIDSNLSTFNTIKPHLLADKLINFNCSPKLIAWLIDFHVNRFKVVKYHNCIVSGENNIHRYPPYILESIMSPVLFTVYID